MPGRRNLPRFLWCIDIMSDIIALMGKELFGAIKLDI